MKAVVECGATKSDWRLIGADGLECGRLQAPGLNLSSMPLAEVRSRLSAALQKLAVTELDAIHLYVAGIVTEQVRSELMSAVRTCVQVTLVEVQNDLMGAARAVCGREPGIVAILGTGSNACFYDRQAVSQAVRSGGFILGDEGSGAVLGKRFLADFLKGRVPPALAEAFSAAYDSSYEAIVASVYRSAAPSAYLGSLAPFLLAHRDNAYVRGLLESNFQDFIERVLFCYDFRHYPLGIAGGFGYACRDILDPLLARQGIRVRCYQPSPVEGLVAYHGQA